jgi:hypothetical protein
MPVNSISKKILNYKQELINSLSDYHYHNGTANPICVWDNAGKVKFYTDGNYGVWKYILTYIQIPPRFDWTGTNNTTINKSEDSEKTASMNFFPDYAWREIIKYAVQFALQNISDQQRSQFAALDVATME